LNTKGIHVYVHTHKQDRQCTHNVTSQSVCVTTVADDTQELPHKRHDFRKKIYWRQTVCFDFPYNFCL